MAFHTENKMKIGCWLDILLFGYKRKFYRSSAARSKFQI